MPHYHYGGRDRRRQSDLIMYNYDGDDIIAMDCMASPLSAVLFITRIFGGGGPHGYFVEPLVSNGSSSPPKCLKCKEEIRICRIYS